MLLTCLSFPLKLGMPIEMDNHTIICNTYAMFSESKISLYVQFKCFSLLKAGTILLEIDFLFRIRNLYAKFEPQLLILHHAHAGLVPQTVFFLFWRFSFIFYFRGRQAVSVASLSWLLKLNGEKEWYFIPCNPSASLQIHCPLLPCIRVWCFLSRCQFDATASLY